MKAGLLVLASACCALVLSSCTEVTFPEPQPKGVPALMQVPPSIRGQYIPIDSKLTDIPRIPIHWKEPTVIIDAWGYYFTDSEGEDWDRGVISDSLVIKHYKEYYFVNFKTENRWVLRLLKPTASGSLDFFAMDLGDEGKETELIKKVTEILEVTKVESGYDTSYEINPTRDQLMLFISMGFFSENEMFRVKRR